MVQQKINLSHVIKKYLDDLDNGLGYPDQKFPSEMEIYREITKLLGAKEAYSLDELKEKINLLEEDKYELFGFSLSNKCGLIFDNFGRYLMEFNPKIQKNNNIIEFKENNFAKCFIDNRLIFNYWKKRAQNCKNSFLKFHYLDRISFFNKEVAYKEKNIVELKQLTISHGLKILKHKNTDYNFKFFTLKRILNLSKCTNSFETTKIQKIAIDLFKKSWDFKPLTPLSIGFMNTNFFSAKKSTMDKNSDPWKIFIRYPSLLIFDWLFFNTNTKIDIKSTNSSNFISLSKKILQKQKENWNDFAFIDESYIIMTNYYLSLTKNSSFWDDPMTQLKLLVNSLLHAKTDTFSPVPNVLFISRINVNNVKVVISRIINFIYLSNQKNEDNIKKREITKNCKKKFLNATIYF